jgi:hypothetical protein
VADPVRGFRYIDAVQAMRRGEICVVAIDPPHALMVTYRMRPVDQAFFLSADKEYRAAAALTYLGQAHQVLAEKA